MIGDAIRADIEAYAVRRSDNPLFKMTEEGAVTKAMVIQYLANLRFMHASTPTHCRRASDRAMDLGIPKLAAYFEEKIAEEMGHEAWADRDMAKLRPEAKVEPNSAVTESIRSLVALIERTIDANPAFYLAYIAFSEYITVILGPAWLDLLSERCGIPHTSMTAIGNHVELDREHAEEVFGCIDDFVTDPKQIGVMRELLRNVVRHFDGFCAEIAASSESSRRQRVAHVSAA